MTRLILSIYDFFRRHRGIAVAVCLALTAGLVASVMTLNYKEDISDFLPLDGDNQTALAVYQDISGTNKIYALVSATDTTNSDVQQLVDGVEALVDHIEASDTAHYVASVTKEVDLEKMLDIADAVYQNLPYFLTDNDYARIDSLLAEPGYVQRQLDDDKQQLLFPSSNMTVTNLQRDPLNLFSPVLQRLSGGESAIAYETYDGYILSPDSKRAIVILESAFGAHESEHNAALVALLDSAATATRGDMPGLDIHYIGGPVIAVGNATQIKSDSVLAVCIAGILIMALLIYVFRNARNIVLIVVSVGWGWLFAMGVIALFYSSVSIIVIGIASVILGIAVNYPLHLIDHLKDSDNPRAAIKEIVGPLVVGNVTTVGAFLCLVPLNAPALHDLGLFASLLLIGTIIFVLAFLPQAVRTRRSGQHATADPKLITRLAAIKLDNKRWVVISVLVLTVVFGFFSFKTEFDTDMRNINFMTDEMRADLSYFQSLTSKKQNTETVYVVSNGSSWDDALAQNESVQSAIDSLTNAGVATRHNHVSDFLTSQAKQAQRLARWQKFVADHKSLLTDSLSEQAVNFGFNAEAFDTFNEMIAAEYKPIEFDGFEQLVSTAFMGNVSHDDARHSIVETIEVAPDDIDDVKNAIAHTNGFDGLVFDVKSMNGAIANTLSNDFNYIGIVCGFIVFIFLWISLGSLELAIVSFMPMAVSWVWILGLMGIIGIKFNIVNVILATFIFGQGDDYTIFMTEGLSYELAYRKKLLDSYKNSIIVSALIMFIGIGTLVFAKHPAMRSLGEVTIVGMLSVVIMAYLFPPLIFNWLVRKNGSLRQRPITIKKIFNTAFCASVFITQLYVGYIIGFVLLKLTAPTPRKRLLLHKYCCSVFRWDVTRMPGLKYRYENTVGESFDKPAVIISNHQSVLDSFYLMTLTPKMVMIANDHVGTNFLTGRMFRWLGFITVGMGIEDMVVKLRPYVEQGYSVAIYPEGERPRYVSNGVKRFRKGMIQFAKDFNLDILPVYLHGIVQAMPKGSAVSNGGEVVLHVGKRISLQQLNTMGETDKEQAKAVKRLFMETYTDICRKQSTVKLVAKVVYDRYRYKGVDIERNARHMLRHLQQRACDIEGRFECQQFGVVDIDAQGELTVLLAVMYPDSRIISYIPDDDNRHILEGCLENFAKNVIIVDDSALAESCPVSYVVEKNTVTKVNDITL